MGHSAGGHLALWLGARSRISRDSPLYAADPLPLRGIVALAPASDLVTLHERKVFDHVVDKLMGGSPGSVPDRYDAAMPSRLLPLGVRQVLITGAHDDVWRHSSETYAEVARNAQDTEVEFHLAPAAGHFEPIAPHSTTWPLVLHHLQRILRP
jgi:acetyl esterase/lipase